MSSIVAGMNAERTNRWLLIGAAVLAVLAGVLVFALLANFGGDDNKSSVKSNGSEPVLVAAQTIKPGVKVTEAMFRPTSVNKDILVPNAVSDTKAIVGQTARVEILEGQQISAQQFVGGPNIGDVAEQLTFKVPDGMRAYSMRIAEDTAVGGHIVPGDRVDLIVRYTTKQSLNDQVKRLHVELLAGNIEVLARAQEDVKGVGAIVTPSAATPTAEEVAGVDNRPTKIDPDPGAATLTLALTPQQVLDVKKFLSLQDGEISVALRRFGDDNQFGANPVDIPVIE